MQDSFVAQERDDALRIVESAVAFSARDDDTVARIAASDVQHVC
jgi:hypothetical protein